MNINLSISPAPGITNYLVAAVYEATNPNVAVQYEVLPKPLIADVNVTFIGLNPVVHICIIWENTTDVPGGSIRHKFIYDPEYSNATVEVREDLFLTVGAGGDNPVAGTSEFTLTSLTDWTYTVERRGYGSMEPGVDMDLSADHKTIYLIKGDGVNNDVFGDGEVFILHFEPKIITNQPIESQTSGAIFSETVTLTTNTTLTSDGVGKAYKLQGTNDTIVITLPALNTMPENRHMAFISEGGLHKNATLQAAGSDTIEWLNSVRQTIILGQSERVWVYVADGKWIVSDAYGGFSRVGEIYMSYDNSDINAVYANGALLDRAVYARLWEWVQNLSGSAIVTDANWQNEALLNKGRFSYGDGVSNFRVPAMHIPGFIRAVDANSRSAGSYEAQKVGQHSHKMFGNDGNGSTVTETTKSSRGHSTGGNMGYNITQSNGEAIYGVTSVNSDSNNSTENTPANVGLYFMIRT